MDFGTPRHVPFGDSNAGICKKYTYINKKTVVFNFGAFFFFSPIGFKNAFFFFVNK